MKEQVEIKSMKNIRSTEIRTTRRGKKQKENMKKVIKEVYYTKRQTEAIYSYVRNKQKVKRVVPGITGAGIITSSEEEIAQELGHFLDRFSQGKLITTIIIQNSKAECTEIITCKMLYLPRTMYVKS